MYDLTNIIFEKYNEGKLDEDKVMILLEKTKDKKNSKALLKVGKSAALTGALLGSMNYIAGKGHERNNPIYQDGKRMYNALIKIKFKNDKNQELSENEKNILKEYNSNKGYYDRCIDSYRSKKTADRKGTLKTAAIGAIGGGLAAGGSAIANSINNHHKNK